MIDYTKRPLAGLFALPAVNRTRRANLTLAEFIAAGTTNPNRPIVLAAGQAVNLTSLSTRRSS